MAARVIPPSTRARYACETLAAYAAYGFFKCLPPETASDLGGWLMRGAGPRMGISRVALRNLSLAFPEKSEAERNEILLGMWDNLGRVIGEYPHLGYIRDTLEIRGWEEGDKALPAIFFGGHIANWEVCALGARKAGFPLALVYRKPNNAGVDGLIRRARSAGTARHIPKGPDGARAIVAALKNGVSIGMLTDQKLGEGPDIPFFGRPAPTADAPAILALKFGCPLYPVRVERLGPARFRMTVHPALEVKDTGNKEADAARALTEMNALLESWIREEPAHWLWTHRRWREG
jgi:KDO2-lipid IV(A) lauroyltransferase